ncbi:hypothetical protein MPH_03213 [Macrophomina phaseolina MS6]|uniref:Uncharacterized protein n=1 Tax=Macrophomina phaseolina (strain MS6) TaxID=1126212 RepID=K2SRN0_MACPH|nr:hypothetical protein MPH_03213 [Macrophomina phaseolina MS6]
MGLLAARKAEERLSHVVDWRRLLAHSGMFHSMHTNVLNSGVGAVRMNCRLVILVVHFCNTKCSWRCATFVGCLPGGLVDAPVVRAKTAFIKSRLASVSFGPWSATVGIPLCIRVIQVAGLTVLVGIGALSLTRSRCSLARRELIIWVSVLVVYPLDLG